MNILHSRLKDSYLETLFWMLLVVSPMILIFNYIIVVTGFLFVPDLMLRWTFYAVVLGLVFFYALKRKKLFSFIIFLVLVCLLDLIASRFFPNVNELFFCGRYFVLLFTGILGTRYFLSVRNIRVEEYIYQPSSRYPKIPIAIWLLVCVIFIFNLFAAYTVIKNKLFPSVWIISTIFSFLILLYNFLPDSYPSDRPSEEERPQITPQMVLERLKNDKNYRGQISSTLNIPGWQPHKEPGNTTKDKSELKLLRRYPFLNEIFQKLDIKKLYKHQEWIIDLLGNDERKDAIIGLIPGAGKSTTIDICSVITTLAVERAENVLYVTTDNPHARLSLFKKRIADTSVYHVLKPELLSPKTLKTLDTSKPDILFCNTDTFSNLLLDRANDELNGFVANLGLVILEDVDQYSPVKLTHLSYLVRRLRLIVDKKEFAYPQFFICTVSGIELTDLGSEFLGKKDFEIFEADGSARQDITYISWSNPWNAEGKLGRIKKSSVKVNRTSYIDEFYRLISNLSIFEDFSVLWTVQDKELTNAEIQDMEAAIRDKYLSTHQEEGVEDELSLENYTFLRDFRTGIRRVIDTREKFDVIISLGLGKEPKSTIEMAQKLLVDKGLFIHVVGASPLDNFIKMNPSENLLSHTKVIKKRVYFLENKDSFLMTHLIPTISRAELFEEPTDKELKNVFGIDELENLFLSDYIDRELLEREMVGQDEDGNDIRSYFFNEKFNENLEPNVPLNLEQYPGNQIMEIRDEEKEVITSFPADIFQNNLFPDAIWNFRGCRFTVNNVEPINERIHCNVSNWNPIESLLFSSKYFISTSAIYSIAESEGKKPAKQTETSSFTRELGKMTFQIKNNHFVKISSSGNIDDCEIYKHYEGRNGLLKFESNYCSLTPVGVDKGENYSVSHALVHLLKLFMPLKMLHFNKLIEILLDETGQIFFIEKLDSQGSIITQIYNDPLADILNLGLELLLACSCPGGCPNCLKMISCSQENWNKELNKEGLMKFLGRNLNRKDVDFIVSCRNVGLPTDDRAYDYVFSMRDDILKVLKEKFGLDILTPGKLIYIQDDELNKKLLSGCYTDDNQVKINHGMTETRTRSVLVHEYAHNWQFDPGNRNLGTWIMDSSLSYKGKILVEGFAQWVSYRYLDFLCADREMEKIDLHCDDEYGDGFDVMKYIEDRHGFFEVIRFMKGQSQVFPDLESLRQIEKETPIEVFQKKT